MYKVIVTDFILNKIDIFIEWYLNTFLSLIEDSGIYNEHIIKNNYIEISQEFKSNIIESIKESFKEEIIWKKILKNAFQTTVLVWNYRLFVDFEEDNQDKIRFIENIEFHKR